MKSNAKKKPAPVKAEPATVDYLLRDVDAQLWAKFKGRAEASGLPMRSCLVQLLKAYADGQLVIDTTPTVTTKRK